MRKIESQYQASGHGLLPMNEAKQTEHLSQLVACIFARYQLHSENQADICGLAEEAEEEEVPFENSGDIEFME